MSLFFTSRKNFETKVAQRAMEACEQIVKEMGAELHDDLIQKLSVFRLYLDRLERSAQDPVETLTIVTRMRSDFEDVIRSVRNVSRRLLPVLMEEDSFQKNVHLLCQNMEHPGEAHIHFESHGEEISLPTLVEAYLYRIVQELIHNAFKHSAAWHIWVRIHWEKRKLTIEVEDDGTGFSKVPEFLALLKKKHNTMHMRSQAINAHINYHQGAKGLIAKVEYGIGP